MRQYNLVISINSLMSGDLSILKELDNFKYIVSKGTCINKVINNYPNLRNPINTTILTGESPENHGIFYDSSNFLNTKFKDKEYEDIKVKTLIEAFKEKENEVSTISWPITEYGNFKYNFTYLSSNKINSIFKSILKGSSIYMLKNIFKYSKILKVNTQPDYDNFSSILMMELLERGKSNVIFLNLNNLEYTRKRYSINSNHVQEAFKNTDKRIGDIIKWCKNKKILDRTNIFIVSNGGMYNCQNSINVNYALLKEGFIILNSKKNKIKDYIAYSHCEGGAAFIYFKNPMDMNVYGKVKIFLEQFAKRNSNFIKSITESKSILGTYDRTKYSFILEARPNCIFDDSIFNKKNIIDDIDSEQFLMNENMSKAFYGYSNGSENSNGIFISFGSKIKQGIEFEECNIEDIAPTIAYLNNLDFMVSRGRAIYKIRK